MYKTKDITTPRRRSKTNKKQNRSCKAFRCIHADATRHMSKNRKNNNTRKKTENNPTNKDNLNKNTNKNASETKKKQTNQTKNTKQQQIKEHVYNQRHNNPQKTIKRQTTNKTGLAKLSDAYTRMLQDTWTR